MKREGGMAFPGGSAAEIAGGMTLRDYFAGQALLVYAGADIGKAATETWAEARARLAYAIADAMIAKREEG